MDRINIITGRVNLIVGDNGVGKTVMFNTAYGRNMENVIYVRSDGLAPKQFSLLLDRQERGQDLAVLSMMRFVKPDTKDRFHARSALVDGAQRKMQHIAMAIIGATDRMGTASVIIDEIENSLHHTVFPDLWREIFGFAERYSFRVFVSTHSYDCVMAFAKEAQGYHDGFAVATRLEPDKVVTYLKRDLEIVYKERIEIR